MVNVSMKIFLRSVSYGLSLGAIIVTVILEAVYLHKTITTGIRMGSNCMHSATAANAWCDLLTVPNVV